ncbi:MAG: hypothetical protein R3F33_11120 [Planctomycetota bacterium]
MGFSEAFDVAHQALVSSGAFGETVIIRRADASAEFEISAVPIDEPVYPDEAGMDLSTSMHGVGVRKADLVFEPDQGDLVMIGSNAWVVADYQDEGQGVVNLWLHKGV